MKTVHSDHRTRVTKMLIRKAMTKQLENKPIQNITIKELCETAGINRGTFYAHYSDLYQLMDELEDEMTKEFQKTLDPLLDRQGESPSPISVTTAVFQCLKENADLCTVTLGEYGDKAFAERLLNMGRERCKEAYTRYFANTSQKQIEFYYAFVSAGCIGLLRQWLEEGMTTSAKEVATMAEHIMLYGISSLNNAIKE